MRPAPTPPRSRRERGQMAIGTGSEVNQRAFQRVPTINPGSMALIYAASAMRFPIRTRLKAAVAISAQSWLRLTPR